MNFSTFKSAINDKWKALSASAASLYVVDLTKDEMWEAYLTALAPDDRMFKTRTEHDCSGCRHFIRDVGNVVAINADGTFTSVWDVDMPDQPVYQRAADALSELVRSRKVVDKFLSTMSHAGAAPDRALAEDGSVQVFEHFHVKIDSKHVTSAANVGQQLNQARTSAQLLARALTEITADAVNEVLDLINSGSIYRGAEFKDSVAKLAAMQAQYNALNGSIPLDVFCWQNITSPVARIKNTAIGTLLEDLSEGYDLDDAVKAFERKVAPENYQRPTALVTPRMVEQARQKVAELGLLDSIERRYAALTDVSVNNVLFADRSARGAMKDAGDVFEQLAAKTVATNSKKFDRATKITIDKFLSDVVPNAQQIEVLFESRHSRNLVSLITEKNEGSPQLFKWNNPFSWSYNGDLTDSIKERVKAAGGNVTGDVCCRLAWNNYDDLDLHMIEHTNRARSEIYFGNKSSSNGGRLDVDANAGYGSTRTPVENIFYQNAATMKDGKYNLFVHQYCSRDKVDNDFTVEIDVRGDVYTFHGTNPRTNGRIDIANIVKKNGEITVEPLMELSASSSVTRTEWGIETNQFHRVNAMMFSPNHWDGEAGIGNKHVFFLLDGCVNEGNARGFYNEFLRGELNEHRKVLEMIGQRQRTEETENQLSGLGYSLTKKDELIVQVTGSTKQVFRIII